MEGKQRVPHRNEAATDQQPGSHSISYHKNQSDSREDLQDDY